ncbi:MAG: hypothetical protein DRJ65_06495 [Acidobacteria bacterium]|nr:MAG: hypothetical protein DRJ65_06495 [Acidobacteriota bacterium]
MVITPVSNPRELVDDERRLVELSPHGGIRIGVGYPNSYRVALSSLAHQWITRLSSRVADVGVERFYLDGSNKGRTFEYDSPLGDMDILAFTVSFELDAVHLLQILDDGGIPRRWEQRTARDPLIVVGGPVASINPLPLSPAIDVFCLGAGEILLPELLEAVKNTADRSELLEDLATRDGFFVPRHNLDAQGRPLGKCRRLEKRDRHIAEPNNVPASHIITPHTEYRNRGLIEMSRGCPEKCSYCWVSFNYGRLRSYETEHIMARVDELASVTQKIGFIATAVGDHPDLAQILQHCRERDLEVALSSLRIPAMVPEVLQPLAESGARSVTIAPETGSESLRHRLNKPISNQRILEAAETAQICGIDHLKMYFILGLPDETDDDILSIASLLRATHQIMLDHGRPKGRVGNLHAGVSILVPKPYTPYQGAAMIDAREARRRIKLLRRALTGLPNFKLDVPSYREAVWQGFLSRGTADAFTALEDRTAGSTVSKILTDHRTAVQAATTNPDTADQPWSFISSAPVTKDSQTPAKFAKKKS